MDLETRFAEQLSTPSAKEKTASAFRRMSIEELEQFLRDEGYGQDKTASADYGSKKDTKKYKAKHRESLVKWADAQGREMARLEKTALPAAGLAMGALKRGVGTAAGKVLTTGVGARAAVGAGVGAVGGALRNPGVNAQGQQNSRLGNVLGGAAIGAGAGAASKAAVQGLGGMNNAVGRYVGGATKQVAKQTGSSAAMAAAKGMQQSRMAAGATARTQKVIGKQAVPGLLSKAEGAAAPAAAAVPAAAPTAAAAAGTAAAQGTAAAPGMFQRAGNAVQGVANRATTAVQGATSKAKKALTTPLKLQSPIALSR